MAENENIQNPVQNPAPTPTPTVVKPTIVTSGAKKGRKLSPKLVVVGCIAFIAVFIIGLFGALYLGLQNPGKLSNIGIEPANAKSLLMIIASVFFGVIFLFGFGFFGLNTYRLIRNKTGKRGKYLAGIFLGLLLLAISIGLGAVAIIKVQNIKVDTYANTDDLVIPYLLTSSPGTPQVQYTYAKAPGIYMIAPLDVAFQVNEAIVNIFSELGLPDSSVIWDMESDGTPDKENKVSFGYNYIEPQLYMVSYRFPSINGTLSNLQYHFYLRVNQSDTPRCSIAVKNDGNTYEFTTLRSGGDSAVKEINSYRREIYDIDTEKNIQSIPARTDNIEYTFEKQ